MFGLSLTKVLLTVLVAVAAWRVFGMLERARQATPVPRAGRAPEALEFEACPRCGDYVERDRGCPRCRGSA